MLAKMNPPGTPLPDNHLLTNGLTMICGVKPVPPSREDVAWAEEVLLAKHRRNPTGSETTALIKQRHKQGAEMATQLELLRATLARLEAEGVPANNPMV